MDWDRLGDYVRAEMKRRGWRQEDLAHHAGVSPRSISSIVQGRPARRWPPSIAAVELALGWRPGTARRILDGQDPLNGDGRLTHDDYVEMAIEQLRHVPARERLRLLSRLIDEAGDDLDGDEASR